VWGGGQEEVAGVGHREVDEYSNVTDTENDKPCDPPITQAHTDSEQSSSRFEGQVTFMRIISLEPCDIHIGKII